MGPLVFLGRVVDLDDLILDANFLQARHDPRRVGEHRRSEHLHRRHLCLLSSASPVAAIEEIRSTLCYAWYVVVVINDIYATQNELSLANY